jgi:hypothetical protein
LAAGLASDDDDDKGGVGGGEAQSAPTTSEGEATETESAPDESTESVVAAS